MIIAALYYVFLGFLMSMIVRGMRGESYPTGLDTLGIMVIWPLYVIKWIVLAIVWLFHNAGRSMVSAVKGLFN